MSDLDVQSAASVLNRERLQARIRADLIDALSEYAVGISGAAFVIDASDRWATAIVGEMAKGAAGDPLAVELERRLAGVDDEGLEAALARAVGVGGTEV